MSGAGVWVLGGTLSGVGTGSVNVTSGTITSLVQYPVLTETSTFTAAGSAGTVTFAAANASTRVYINHVAVQAYNVAVVAATTVPVSFTISNLGGFKYLFPTGGLNTGSLTTVFLNPSVPLAAAASGTDCVLVAEANAAIRWAISASYYNL